ncbi:major facilitator superfamily domain-containing protein [Geopyxis carbonaria]|nr:major facilitator superfamily domain-containing protein [Geopyxis carbonaria]
MQRRKSSYHYQTFPTNPPSSRGQPPSASKDSSPNRDADPSDGCSPCSSERSPSSDQSSHTPIPKKQLVILAIISLSEQTALNSISPYLPQMAASFPEVDVERVGLYVGIIASSFAAAQFSSNVFWGRLSDRIGRKPIILLGTFLTSILFVAFGFCRTLWQAITVQALMGLVNANAGVVSTVLGEITDKSNQSSAFSYLPIVYGIGGIMGPIIGGILVNPSADIDGPMRIFQHYPYLLPNVVSALVLILDFGFSLFMLDESLKAAQSLPPLGARMRCLFSWLWQFTASYRPSYLRNIGGSGKKLDSTESLDRLEHENQTLAEACPAIFPDTGPTVSYSEILVPQIILLLLTYTFFNLTNIAFNSLFPIYASAPRPTGRELSPKEIGLSLSFAGLVAIVFQGFLFTPIQSRLGNLWCYRLAFLGFVVAMFVMPFVGRYTTHAEPLIWAEFGIILLIKTVSTVGGLTCSMLLITNASPKPSTLGTLNGLAQTLSAGGRAFSPLLSGALFTASTKIQPFGEFLAWGVFGGVAALGLFFSSLLRSRKLECDETTSLFRQEAPSDEEVPVA